MTADDAYTIVSNALFGLSGNDADAFGGLTELRLSDLNSTERGYALEALDALDSLDDALAERSTFESAELGRDESGRDDE